MGNSSFEKILKIYEGIINKIQKNITYDEIIVNCYKIKVRFLFVYC